MRARSVVTQPTEIGGVRRSLIESVRDVVVVPQGRSHAFLVQTRGQREASSRSGSRSAPPDRWVAFPAGFPPPSRCRVAGRVPSRGR